MIYDSNDVSFLFLPEKKISVMRFSELITAKGRHIRERGMKPSNSYKKNKLYLANNLLIVMASLFIFAVIPGNITLAINIDSPFIFLICIPLLELFPIVACAVAVRNRIIISGCQRYSAECVGYLHMLATGGKGANIISTPLYRLDTETGTSFVYCSFRNFTIGFPSIGQIVNLYVGVKGPEECYDRQGNAGLIISFVVLGLSLLINAVVLLIKFL